MTIGLEHAPALAAEAGARSPELTAEKARELAAVLAEHMMAMRAVTAGTQYESSGRQPLAPATEIFLAGMLERIRAGEVVDLEDARPAETVSAEAVSAEAVSAETVSAETVSAETVPPEPVAVATVSADSEAAASDDVAMSGLAVLAG